VNSQLYIVVVPLLEEWGNRSTYRNPRPVTRHWLPESHKIHLTTDWV
jgi:hypothetical protein